MKEKPKALDFDDPALLLFLSDPSVSMDLDFLLGGPQTAMPEGQPAPKPPPQALETDSALEKADLRAADAKESMSHESPQMIVRNINWFLSA